jgi:hypothetical protein
MAAGGESSPESVEYSRLPSSGKYEGGSDDDGDLELEDHELLTKRTTVRPSRRLCARSASKILAIANVLLTFVLLGTWMSMILFWQHHELDLAPTPPYCMWFRNYPWKYRLTKLSTMKSSLKGRWGDKIYQ